MDGIGHDEFDGGEQLLGRMHLHPLRDQEAQALSGISQITILFNQGKNLLEKETATCRYFRQVDKCNDCKQWINDQQLKRCTKLECLNGLQFGYIRISM